MKKTLVWAATSVLCGSLAWADVCSDMKTQYGSLILRLEQETQAALSQTFDPTEQAAIRDSFQMQKASLEAERDGALAASNCNAPPVTPPTTDPGTNPGTPPSTDPDPSTNPGPDPVTPPSTDPNPGTDPGEQPGTQPDDNACKDLMDQVREEAHLRAASGGAKAAAQYLRSRRDEIKAICGATRPHCRPKSECKRKPDCDDDKPKCEPKPEPKSQCEPKRCEPKVVCPPKPKCEPKPSCERKRKNCK